MKRFFISDTHFNDDRLNLYGRDLLFKTKEEVNYNIVNNWNKIVKPTDLVIHLGDIAMNEDGLNLLNKCNGRKILIKGNYDESETSKFDISDELLLRYFDEVLVEKTIIIGGEPVYLNHFPEKGKSDYFNLVGHIHGLWKVQRNMINVGCDAWNYQPISEDTIIFFMNAIRKYYDINVFAGELDCNLYIKELEKDKEITLDNVLSPPEIVETEEKTIFLAGPIQGASDWHTRAINFLNEHRSDKTFKIASPKKKYEKGTFDLEKQIDWESFHLKQASTNGLIIFWLDNEVEHNPERAYAQTSRFELAEWLNKNLIDDNVKVLVGIDTEFSGADYIIDRIESDYKCIDNIYDNLEDMLTDALKFLLDMLV